MRFTTDTAPLDVTLTALTIAGWTGRDGAAVQHHIEELAAIGVPRPSTTPLFYRAAPALAAQGGVLTVLGPETSGEVEPLLLRAGGVLWLGLGSDHTDRGLEATSVAHSKQVCGKPLAGALWRFDTVADRLDRLTLRSWIPDGDGWAPYQDGTLAAIRPLADLLAAHPLTDGTAMLCGTLPALGGVRPAPAYRMELGDPETGRAIGLDYRVADLPIVS